MNPLCKGCPDRILYSIPLWKGSVVYEACDGQRIEECMQEARQ